MHTRRTPAKWRCRRAHGLFAVVAVSLLAACGAAPSVRPAAVPSASPSGDSNDAAAIRATIDALYAAFCFDAGAEPDWDVQRRIYLDGASFVRPADEERAPVADDLETFLSTFEGWATEGEHAATGFHERVIGVRIEAFGGIAHAFVAFEGFRPGSAETVTRGVDSLQLVRDGELWRLTSFATQYESSGHRLPERFLGRAE